MKLLLLAHIGVVELVINHERRCARLPCCEPAIPDPARGRAHDRRPRRLLGIASGVAGRSSHSPSPARVPGGSPTGFTARDDSTITAPLVRQMAPSTVVEYPSPKPVSPGTLMRIRRHGAAWREARLLRSRPNRSQVAAWARPRAHSRTPRPRRSAGRQTRRSAGRPEPPSAIWPRTGARRWA